MVGYNPIVSFLSNFCGKSCVHPKKRSLVHNKFSKFHTKAPAYIHNNAHFEGGVASFIVDGEEIKRILISFAFVIVIVGCLCTSWRAI